MSKSSEEDIKAMLSSIQNTQRQMLAIVDALNAAIVGIGKKLGVKASDADELTVEEYTKFLKEEMQPWVQKLTEVQINAVKQSMEGDDGGKEEDK